MITKKDAEMLARVHKKDGVIIIHFNFKKGDPIGYTSYGRDKELSDEMKDIADQIYQEMMTGSIDVRFSILDI